ncbi:hypothetical protein TNCV_4285391 [Trichonephila clavipes]|nr:hypothetical protein TNCV_4285391 [Trichonephila clavipes]
MPSRCSQSIFYSQRHRRSSSFHSNLGLSPFHHPRPAPLSPDSFFSFFPSSSFSPPSSLLPSFLFSKRTLLYTRGVFTTRPSSLIIGRPQNTAHGLIRVLLAYGTHNHTLCPVWNVLAPDFSFDIWTFCSSHCLCSLEPFSNHLPRRQCSPLDRLRLLSMGAGILLCPL